MSRYDKTKESQVIVTDKWFKLRLVSKKDPTNVDFAYVSGLHVTQVKEDYSFYLKDYKVSVRPVEYSRIIRNVC